MPQPEDLVDVDALLAEEGLDVDALMRAEGPEPTSTGLRGAMNYMADHPIEGSDVGHAIGAAGSAIGQGVKGLAGGVVDAYQESPTADPVALAGRVALGAGRGLVDASMGEFERAAAQEHLDEVEGRGYGEGRGPTGKGLSALGHRMAGAIPGVGPLAAGIVERGAEGDVAGAVGELGGNVLLARGMRAAGEAAPAFPERLSNARAARVKAIKDAEYRRTSQLLAVKGKDFERGMDPTGTVLKSGVDLSKPRGEIMPQMEQRLDALDLKELPFKADPRTVATATEISRLAGGLRETAHTAMKAGNEVAAKAATRVHDTLMEMLNGTPGRQVPNGVLDAQGRKLMTTVDAKPSLFGENLTGASASRLIENIDGLIGMWKGTKRAAPVVQELYGLRRKVLDNLDPEWKQIRLEKRDTAQGKRALGKQILKDKAAYPPRQTSGIDSLQQGLDAFSNIPVVGRGAALPAALLRTLRNARRATGR